MPRFYKEIIHSENAVYTVWELIKNNNKDLIIWSVSFQVKALLGAERAWVQIGDGGAPPTYGIPKESCTPWTPNYIYEFHNMMPDRDFIYLPAGETLNGFSTRGLGGAIFHSYYCTITYTEVDK